MAQSMGSRAQSTPLNSIAPRPAKASIAINEPCLSAPIEAGDDPVSLFFDAVAASGLSEKEAAYAMAMDKAQLSRVKTGAARLPFDAMWRLPDRFWLEFAKRVDAAKGLNPQSDRSMRIARIAELVRLLVEQEVA